MHSITALWLPIIVSTLAVFVLSSVINMALPWHKGDFRAPPGEDAILDALRNAGVQPGDYMVPYASGMEDMRSEAHKQKVLRGPVVVMSVMQRKSLSIAPMLGGWFIYVLVISILAACMAVVGAASGESHTIFHVVGLFTWAAYAAAVWPLKIWYGRSTRGALTTTLDGLIYAVATGLIFVWLWR